MHCIYISFDIITSLLLNFITKVFSCTVKLSGTHCVLQVLKQNKNLNSYSQQNSWFQTFAMSWMLYAFFWVIPWRLNFIHQRFGTLCLFHFSTRTCLPMKMEQTECSETSAHKIQTPGNHPKESIRQYSCSNQPQHKLQCLWAMAFISDYD